MTDELYRIVTGMAMIRPRRGYAGPRDLPLNERNVIEAARETGALEDLFGKEYGERIAAVFDEYNAGFDLHPDRQRKVGAIIEELLAIETKARLFPDVSCACIDLDIAESISEGEKAALRARGRIVDERKPVAVECSHVDNKGGAPTSS